MPRRTPFQNTYLSGILADIIPVTPDDDVDNIREDLPWDLSAYNGRDFPEVNIFPTEEESPFPVGSPNRFMGFVVTLQDNSMFAIDQDGFSYRGPNDSDRWIEFINLNTAKPALYALIPEAKVSENYELENLGFDWKVIAPPVPADRPITAGTGSSYIQIAKRLEDPRDGDINPVVSLMFVPAASRQQLGIGDSHVLLATRFTALWDGVCIRTEQENTISIMTPRGTTRTLSLDAKETFPVGVRRVLATGTTISTGISVGVPY